MNAKREADELLKMSSQALEEHIVDELSAIDTTGDHKRSAYLGMALRVLREVKDGGNKEAKALADAFSKVASELVERAAPLVAAKEEDVEESFWQSISSDVKHQTVSPQQQEDPVMARARNLEIDPAPVASDAVINERAKELAKQVLKEVPNAAKKPKRMESSRSPAYKREKLRCEKAAKYFDLRRRGISREDAAKLAKIAASTSKNYDNIGPSGFRVQPRYVNHENINLRIPPLRTDKWPPSDVVDRCILDKAEAERKQKLKEEQLLQS